MRLIYFFGLLLIASSCSNNRMNSNAESHEQSVNTDDSEFLIEVDSLFEGYVKSNKVKGIVAILQNDKKDILLVSDTAFLYRGGLPASTFKIPNSIIALETDIVKNDSTVFFWDGQPRRMKIWEKDMMFREAFHLSCVPCYQEVARKIGPKRMRHYLNQFDYGTMDFDSSSIDRFWLEGNSVITPWQQLQFVRKFYNNDLGVSDRTTRVMKRLMFIDSVDGYRLSGKTGWAIREGHDHGWFVGYSEKAGEVAYVVVYIERTHETEKSRFPQIRKELAIRALNNHWKRKAT